MDNKKGFNVCLVECQNFKQFPHMNMPLFIRDIEEIGCNVDSICVNLNKINVLLEYLKDNEFNLIAIDSYFPYKFIEKIKKVCPPIKIVIGGVGFFDMFYKTQIDYGIAGAGRKSITMLIDALKNKKSLAKVPNLFFKLKKGSSYIIDYSGKENNFNLKKELFPYRPMLKWKYLGFDDDNLKDSDTISHPASLIAEFGCPMRIGNNIPNMEHPNKDFPHALLTGNAKKKLSEILEERQSGGCSFCSYGRYFSLSKKETIEYLIKQIIYLQKEYGFDSFSISTENPFRFLPDLIKEIFKRKINLKNLHIRTRIDLLLKSKKILISSINLAIKHDFKLHLGFMGFESFNQKELNRYNKKQSVQDNLDAIKLLDELDMRYKSNFFNTYGSYGFLGISPWATIEDINKELKIINKLPRIWREYFQHSLFFMDLELYDPLLPIYGQLKEDNLIKPNSISFDNYEYKDKIINKLCNYLKLGASYEKNKKYILAIKNYKKAIDILPTSSYLHFLIGKIYLELKSISHAAEYLNKAIKLGYQDRDVHFILGSSYLKKKKYNAAMQEFDKAEEISPDNYKINLSLSECYKGLGDQKKAKAELQKFFIKRKKGSYRCNFFKDT
jgi:tetratricopeptide (TPR) repeat protein